MGPAGDTTPASKLHGAYDDQYLLRLVSQKGKPGIFAFETCLHDQGIARQGTCVSALQNLKGEPVPISIEVIANEQLSSKEVEVLAAVKREHSKYTAALAARAEQRYGAEVLTIGIGAPSLVIGGLAVDSHLKGKIHTLSRHLVASESILKKDVARLEKYLGEYAAYVKIEELRHDNAAVRLARQLEDLNAEDVKSMFDEDMVKWLDETGLPEPLRGWLKVKGFGINTYLHNPNHSIFDDLIRKQYGANRQAFDDIVKTAMQGWADRNGTKFIGSMVNDALFSDWKRGNHFFTEYQSIEDFLAEDLRGWIARWNEFRYEFPKRFHTQDVYRAMAANYDLNEVRINSYNQWIDSKRSLDDLAKQKPIAAQTGKIGLISKREIRRLKAGKIAAMAAVVIGFGATIYGAHRVNAFKAGAVGDDNHEEEWLALLESGQVDLITDFSSSLWTPDATEHTDVPSVKELMLHITLFQRELWFGATSDAPDVVQIVKHCLPQKSFGGGVQPQCESVVGLGT